MKVHAVDTEANTDTTTCGLVHFYTHACPVTHLNQPDHYLKFFYACTRNIALTVIKLELPLSVP